MTDPDDFLSGDTIQQVQLPEAAQAVMDVLEECHSDLAALRYRLKSDEMVEQLDCKVKWARRGVSGRHARFDSAILERED